MPRRARTTASIRVMVLILLVGCATDQPEDVATITYNAAASTPIEVVERARIDGTAANLVRISPFNGVAITSDSGVAVTQSQEFRVAFFNASGQEIGSLGRAGAGPGEFQRIYSLGRLGDSIWVFDSELSRATLISPAREFVRTIPIPRTLKKDLRRNDSDLNANNLFGLTVDGTFVGLSFSGGISLARGALDGALLNLLPAIETPGEGGTSNDAFNIRTWFDVSSDGRLIVITRPFMTGPDAPTVSVTLMKATSDTVFSRIVKFDGEPIPQHVVDSTLAARTRRMPAADAAVYKRDAHVPPFFSPVGTALVGDDQTMWLQLHQTSAGQPYLVLNDRGDMLGTATFPPNTVVAAANRSVVWATHLDEFDVPSIVKYSVSWK